MRPALYVIGRRHLAARAVRPGDRLEATGLRRRRGQLDADSDGRAEHEVATETTVGVPGDVREPAQLARRLEQYADALPPIRRRLQVRTDEVDEAAQPGVPGEGRNRVRSFTRVDEPADDLG